VESFLENLFGVDLSGLAEGQSYRIDWTGLGRGGDRLFFLLVFAVAAAFLLRWLYQRDGRGLTSDPCWLVSDGSHSWDSSPCCSSPCW
jgi:hypothetical protein